MKLQGLEALWDSPLFGIGITLAFYMASLALARRTRRIHPLFVTAGGIVLLLLILDIPYESYSRGGDYITWLLGPATVALAVPLYKSARQIGPRRLRMLAAAVACGALAGLVAVGAIVFVFQGSQMLMLSLLPKSVTAPIAIELVRELGGIPELGGVFAVLTGLLGSMAGPALLRRAGITGDLGIGAAIGTAAHGIGTASLLRESEIQGGISGLAMGMSGMITPLLCIPLLWLM